MHVRLALGWRSVLASRFLAAFVLLAPAALAACATPPTDPDALADYQQKNDPLEPTNRVLYKINDGLDTVIVRPAAMAYHALPQPVRNGVHNVLANLDSPVKLGNDMLEGK